MLLQIHVTFSTLLSFVLYLFFSSLSDNINRSNTVIMGKTSYKKEWEPERPWLKPVNGNPSKARCALCKKEFCIDGSGVKQVESHANSNLHKKKLPNTSQSTLAVSATGAIIHTGGEAVLPIAMQALRAEVLETLHKAEYNQSFSSGKDDGDRYRLMFPGHPAAEHYHSGPTKVAYLLRYGVAEVLLRELIGDMCDMPYTFKFDETTNSQVKKQFDVYISYWSKISDQIVNVYGGSLFIGHCSATDLVKHYGEMTARLGLKSIFLLHLGMDGPAVNLKFENVLEATLLKDESTSILRLGTCSLHPAHTGFKKGLAELNFSFESFFCDIHFFFKLSAARREDYAGMEAVTNIVAAFALKFSATRWLAMKYVGVRCLEQWDNLRQYFLKFLPKQATFKSSVQGTQRYQRIKDLFTKSTTEAYLSFMVFATQDFETFLRRFQYEQPMIHMLYPAMVEMIRALMSKFVAKKYLLSDNGSPKTDEEILAIKVDRHSVVKKVQLIDIGTRAKVLTSDCVMFPNDTCIAFRTECLQFYKAATMYLICNLPHDKSVIKHAQYHINVTY
jgi:hypothetical protein